MEPFIGEIRLFSGNFAPKGWALCEGQLIPITHNTALYSILGITYGGDGKTTFALPDMRGRAPMHQGAGPGLTPRQLGQEIGSSHVTLLTSEMPAHGHQANVNGAATQAVPTDAYWANTGGRGRKLYGATVDTAMSPVAIGTAGGSQPHNNMQPYVGLNFIIALEGVFPPRQQ